MRRRTSQRSRAKTCQAKSDAQNRGITAGDRYSDCSDRSVLAALSSRPSLLVSRTTDRLVEMWESRVWRDFQVPVETVLWFPWGRHFLSRLRRQPRSRRGELACTDAGPPDVTCPVLAPRLRRLCSPQGRLRRPLCPRRGPSTPKKTARCSCCGHRCRGRYDQRTVRVRDIGAADWRFYLEFERWRVWCPRCRNVFVEQLDWLATNPRYTLRFALHVGLLCQARRESRQPETTRNPGLSTSPKRRRRQRSRAGAGLDRSRGRGRSRYGPVRSD